MRRQRGGIYNIGGGYKNVMSVWFEFGPMLEKLFGRKLYLRFTIGGQEIKKCLWQIFEKQKQSLIGNQQFLLKMG